MERLTFYTASAAFCLFLTVALTSAMSPKDGADPECDELCAEILTHGDVPSSGYEAQLVRAWQEEHDEFYARERTDAEKAEFRRQMEEALIPVLRY
jgi:hypothetical protein